MFETDQEKATFALTLDVEDISRLRCWKDNSPLSVSY
jgi:hypothetical protein